MESRRRPEIDRGRETVSKYTDTDCWLDAVRAPRHAPRRREECLNFTDTRHVPRATTGGEEGLKGTKRERGAQMKLDACTIACPHGPHAWAE